MVDCLMIYHRRYLLIFVGFVVIGGLLLFLGSWQSRSWLTVVFPSQDSKQVQDGEFAAVVRTEELDGVLYDCTMYASGKRCVAIGPSPDSPKIEDRVPSSGE